MRWGLTEAKNCLSEVRNRADADGEQTITRRGREYVLLPGEAYRRLDGDAPDFLQVLVEEGPRFMGEFVLPERSRRPLRDPGL